MVFRWLCLYLILQAGFICAIAYPFQQPNAERCNDSASYFAEYANAKKARIWIERALQASGSAKEKARTYLIQGELEEVEGYFPLAMEAYRNGIRYSRLASDKVQEASARRGVANILIGDGNYDSALVYMEQSRNLDPSDTNQIRNDLVSGRYFQARNERDKALSRYQHANDIAIKLHSKKFRALALAGMSNIYFQQEQDMKKTLALLNEAVALQDSSKDANVIARNYGRMANAYMVLGDGKKAEEYLNRGRRIVDISGNLPVRGYILSSMAILMAGNGDLEGSAQLAEGTALIKRTLGQYRQLQNDLFNLAETYMKLGRFDKAQKNLSEGIELSTKLKDVAYLEYFYELAAEMDSLMGNYPKAYSDLRKSFKFKENAIELQRVTAVEELREKYETEQKEKTIAEKELMIQQQKYQQAMIIGVAVVGLLVFAVIIMIIRNRHKVKLQTEKQKQDQLRLQTIIHTQEEVQQSIARDIHDGLVQVLGAAKVSLEAIQGHGDKTVILERVKNASRIMDDACVEARSISHQLLPYSLLKDGLVAALEELFRKSLARYEFIKTGEPAKVNGDAAINIYRIAQELVNNILKHAEADHVTIHLSFFSDRITLVMADDGKGFDASHTVAGAGLMNMQTRAEVIHGSFNIQSGTGKGTQVQLVVPL